MECKLKFEDVKTMFDPVVKKIIRLINSQLNSCNDCSVLLLVVDLANQNIYNQELNRNLAQEYYTASTVIKEGK